MNHGASTEHDAEADEDRRDDRRCRMKLDECVQDHTYGSYVANTNKINIVVSEVYMNTSSRF